MHHKESQETPLCLSLGHPKRERSLKMYYVRIPQGKTDASLIHISCDVYVHENSTWYPSIKYTLYVLCISLNFK